MDYLFKRRVRQLENGRRMEAVVKTFNESVLSAQEVHHFLAAHLGDAYECLYLPKYMRIVQRRDTKEYYWLRKYAYHTSFAVKIGVTSEIIAFKTVDDSSLMAQTQNELIVFDEIPMSMTLEVFLKNCSWYTKEKTELYVSVFYDADEKTLSLQTLNLRGTRIQNFPHGYWKVCTVKEGSVPSDGCVGSKQTIRATELWGIDVGPLEIYDTVSVWTGAKVLKVFKKEDQDFTIPKMLDYWNKFWSIFHC